MSEIFPLSNPEMEHHLSPEEHAAQQLAHQLYDNPEQQRRLDIFKQFLIGSENREQRINGQRPWPAREIDGETWRYSIPVFAGFSNESTVLAVLKDPWHDQKNTNDWLVGQIELTSGEYTEYLVTAVNVDASRRVNLQIAEPKWYGNMPPGMRPGPKQALRDWHRISLHLDEKYLTDEAEIRYGMDDKPQSFYDIEHLGRAIAFERQEHTEAERFTTHHDILSQLALKQTLELPEAA